MPPWSPSASNYEYLCRLVLQFEFCNQVYEQIADTSGENLANTYSEFQFDVTNTSTHKCRFRVNAYDSDVTTVGDSNTNSTFMKFIRLGDT